MLRKILGWLLVTHGVICALGAFFPFYPPIFFFYWLVDLPFAVNLTLVLLFAVSQVVYGVRIAFLEKLRQVRWYWPVLTIIVIVVLLLIYPTYSLLVS